jgi:pyridoxal phosphate enzyme (YggS family)
MPNIDLNFAAIRQDIAKAEEAADRPAGSARLVAVTKTQPDDAVVAALQTGQILFGENYVQEAETRWQALKQKWPDIRLHLIGPLQSNKAVQAVALFDCIETIDRPKLADAIVSAMKKLNRFPACFIQVNTGDEAQKGGVSVKDLPALLSHCASAGLTISGLMCIPPQDEPPAMHFALLQKLAVRHGLNDLSMGMSADYKKAIALGATFIRVGTALFGERQAKP